LTFFDELRAAYSLAAQRSATITHCYQIGKYQIQLCFAGPTLVPLLTPALAHLATSDVVDPDLTLYLWDSESTTTLPPPCPWTQDDVDLRGEIPAFSNDRFLTAIQLDVNAVSILDQHQNLGVYWIDSIDSLRVYEQAAPLKVLLHWWLRDRGLPMIHAAVVGDENGAVLLVGKSGAGKSTTSLLCLNAGLRYISDDRCLLALDPEPQALCIYNSAKLHWEQMERFPNLMAKVNNLDEVTKDKALVHVHDFAPQQIAHQLPIRAILLATVTGRPSTSLTPVSRIKVLSDFTTSTLVYQPGAAKKEVQMMADLVRRLPCYQINLGSDFGEIALAIAKVLNDPWSPSN
jgi:hypothetical protein